MGWKYNPYIIPLITSAAILAVLALFTWRRRPAPGKMPFVFFTLSVAQWSLGYALELGNVALSNKIFWAKLEYIGAVLVPITWFAFALQYTGSGQWLTLRNLAIICIEPLITLVLVWTNDFHALVWSSNGIATIGSLSFRISTYGAWFWVHLTYSYLLFLLGAIHLIKAIIRSPQFYHGQISTVLIAVLAPWIGNALYILNLSPLMNLDLTPFAFTLTGIVLAWSLFHFRLLDIVPVARNAVIESMEDIAIVLDPQDRIVDINQAAQRIIGYEASKAIGQPVAQVLSHLPNLIEHYRNVIEGQEGKSEISLIEGEAKHYFDLRISSLHDKYHRLTGRLAVLHDITERKKAEEVLQKAHDELERQVKERTAEMIATNEQLKQEIEDRQRAEEALKESLMLIGRAKREWESTADSLPQFICLLDNQGNILRTNRTLERWNLGQVVNVKGKRAHQLLHPDCTDPDCYLENFWLRAWGELIYGQSSECEVEDNLMKRYLHVQVRPISPQMYRKGEKTESFAVIVISDITERKQAEEALKENEEYSKTLLDSIHAGVIVIDAETHNILDANSFALEMIGINKENILDRGCHGFICPTEKGKCPVTDLDQVVDSSERILIKANGGQVPILKSVVPIIRTNQRYLIESFVDITERKQAEKERAALEEQLRQSQKMEAMGRLAGGTAHDFNNLLTVIKGYSQISLSQIRKSDPLRENIEEIENASERAAGLTRQLLAFSRRQVMEMKALDLNDVLRDLSKMLRRVIGEDIELVILVQEGLGKIKADQGQIEQVIINLVINARDAMPSAGKLIIETSSVELDEQYARAHIGVTPGPYVKLSVTDTGCGISPEIKERIFEPFFTTKEVGKGTGLGLSTVYGIVKQSEGSIWIYSEPGLGTTFKIYLPRVEEMAGTLTPQDEMAVLPRGNETVLLVEDEPSVLGLIGRLLRKQGYSLIEATNGNEALRMAQERVQEKIHLLLTDIVMPQIGGKDLADRLKTLRPGIKVIFTSGYTYHTIIRQGALEPGIAFLEKPFSPSTLVRMVREVLDS